MTLGNYLRSSQLSGEERFVDACRALDLSVLELWRWAMSDLGSNAQRGVVAEFLVAEALGLRGESRFNEWNAYDLCTADGTKIEVKCSGFLQVWSQSKLSKPSFGVAARSGWLAETNTYGPKRRCADVYVLALHKHTDKVSFNVLDVTQWCFFVIATEALNAYDAAMNKKHKALNLSQVRAVPHQCCSFDGLAAAVAGRRASPSESCKECMVSARVPV